MDSQSGWMCHFTQLICTVVWMRHFQLAELYVTGRSVIAIGNGTVPGAASPLLSTG